MEFLTQNLWLIVLVIAIVILAVVYICKFTKMPKEEQIKQIKEWLLYAVAEAEKELGGGTGKLKLRYVYDKFIAEFDSLALLIPFETFSNLVDEVLEEFRNLLKTSTSISNYIKENNDK
jgi:magnesium-transporting ATPase (P-type)